ncbi:hypothetical protein BFW38_15305 [Terasakiispira papahanaumokuakeensis]|uniref:HTH tetR-type domain-containing protein n=1 Tax=Terasakiispira papahanaumokuakeensis TaxID=197479 RepID=A0A1E2VCI9_9GAMM|nr:TetR family transcriptional regulator [Terasakiispira papahanaumokuakeensis]ODC04691.1 hypothetical protein BFW38_15305 [Terasakiispira papahanaumokuakeensis]
MARRTKAEAARTREALLDAAEALFFERGVNNTSLEQVARHAGLTRGALYWHFRNKADLFRAILDRIHVPFGELVDSIQEQHTDLSPLEVLRLACLEGLKQLNQPSSRRVFSILMHRCERLSDIDPVALKQSFSCDVFQALTKQLDVAHEHQQLNPACSPNETAYMLQFMLAGIFHEWLQYPEESDIMPAAQVSINHFFALIQREA